MQRKGILLAGGAGTRLHPMTQVVVKQLLPVYDKPMVYYPLSTLMLAGITEILIITTPQDTPAFQRLLGTGEKFGVTLHYAEQPRPEGIAQALQIGRDFIAGHPVCLILGDNIFHGSGLEAELAAAMQRARGATVFSYRVEDPHRYGVIDIDARGRPRAIVEKPTAFLSNQAVTGLYFYDEQAVAMAASLAPSARGELEITDINRRYLERDELHCRSLGRGYAWFDAGTPDSLLEAAAFVQSLSRRQGLRLCCPEEVAARRGLLTVAQLRALAEPMAKSDYGAYLLQIAQELHLQGQAQ